MPAKTKRTAPTTSSAKAKPFADRYELLRKAGQGGGGTVYLARELGSQRKVALKILDLRKAKDPSLAQALENEFAALTLLKHRHLAKVLDYGKSESAIYLSSEWIDGEDILTASRGADLNTVFRFVVELLRAVDYLHRRGLLHLDLKPENILIARSSGGESSLRLIDFGLAEWQRQGVHGPGEFSGTPPYAAPELLQEKPPSPASDMYSVGMLLHRIFSEGFPFPSQDPLKILQAQLYAPPLRAANLHSALPDSFADLLYKSVAKDPRDRFASPTEFLAAINLSLDENFSLRDSHAPANILEESDHLFRQEIGAELLRELQTNAGLRLALLGDTGVGKTRLLTRMKEKLQLLGAHPQFFSDTTAFKRGMPGGNEAYPLLLDLEKLDEGTARQIATMASLRQGPVLIVLKSESSVPQGFSTTTLCPLEESEISNFLQKEIHDFPNQALAGDIFRQCRGHLDSFETTLQALREEGFLQWSERGWLWFTDGTQMPEDLLPRHQVRWEERRLRIEEWLRVSPLGLSAELLAGLLGIAADTLDPWLSLWVDQGYFQAHLDSETVLYSVRVPEMDPKHVENRDWEQVNRDLQSYYAKGEFALGVKMLETLKPAEVSNAPALIRVHGARLLTAASRNEQALAFLPEAAPVEGNLAGLHWEVLARIQATLGDLPAAEAALAMAETHYADTEDLSGSSRVHNLRGWTLKKQGNQAAALESFCRAEARAREAKDHYAQGLAEMNRGTVYHDQGKLEKAQECYEEALRSAELAKHPLLQLKLMQNRTNLLYTMGRSSEAEPGCFRLLRLAIQQHNSEARAGALNFLSLFSGQRGDLEHQALYLNQAIESLKGGSSPQLPQLYFNRAHLHWDQNKSTAAQLDTEAALAAAKRSANPFVTAWSHLLLGKILRDRVKPDFKEARRHLETARTEMIRHKLGHLLWEVEFDLGLLTKKFGEPEEARAHFESAKKELERLMPELPENLRQSYLRDRKLERIDEELKSNSQPKENSCPC